MVRLVNSEQGATEQGQCADDVGITAAGVVFSEASVFAPVMSVFDSGPVISDVLHPLFERMGLFGTIADVVARFVERLAEASPVVLDTQSAARMREVHLHGLDRDAADAPSFVASVPFVHDVGKKGVAAVRCARRALMVG